MDRHSPGIGKIPFVNHNFNTYVLSNKGKLDHIRKKRISYNNLATICHVPVMYLYARSRTIGGQLYLTRPRYVFIRQITDYWRTVISVTFPFGVYTCTLIHFIEVRPHQRTLPHTLDNLQTGRGYILFW